MKICIRLVVVGGLYGGGSCVTSQGSGNKGGAGGSGYIGGVPAFKHTNGTTYSPSTSAGQKAGNGYAKITFVAF